VEPRIEGYIRGQPRESTLAAHTISFMAPERELSDFVESNIQFYKKYEDPIFIGKVNYEDLSGEKYKEDFTIDLNFQRERMSIAEKDVSKELEKIAKALQKISSIHFKPLVRTITEKEYRKGQKRMVDELRQRSEQ